ncbi:hypothetical protein [Leifsonia aquatica]|uniref:hypothetical protein n=1 Tax=Leifsonia aquatica TaxID=144185 RepID=UPI003817D95A
MGLIYDASDSANVQSALGTNLAAASTVLTETQNASDRLMAALGTGELTGEGYSAVDALFSQVIAPCITEAKGEIDAVQGELERYVYEDAKVSRYGVLKEDELNTQLAATKSQRDATELQIDANSLAAAAAVSVPGLGESLAATNSRLELVLTQLDDDIRDLEDRLQALRAFASATSGLFMDTLESLAAVTGDTVALLNQLNQTPVGFSLVDDLGQGAGALATRRKILDFLAGKKITKDADGRVRWGDRFLYRSKSDRLTEVLYGRGKEFNEASKIRIDHYRKPVISGALGAAESIYGDFTGWKDASNLGRVGKGLGVAGIALSVVGNANNYFHDGIQGKDVPDFFVDTGVDLASAAVAAGAGAAIGSLILPPLGTIVGAGVGIFIGMAFNADVIDGKSATDLAKDAAKNLYR